MKSTVFTALFVAALTCPVIASAHHLSHSHRPHIKPVSVSKGIAPATKPMGAAGDPLPATQSGHRAPGDSLDPMYHGGG